MRASVNLGEGEMLPASGSAAWARGQEAAQVLHQCTVTETQAVCKWLAWLSLSLSLGGAKRVFASLLSAGGLALSVSGA